MRTLALLAALSLLAGAIAIATPAAAMHPCSQQYPENCGCAHEPSQPRDRILWIVLCKIVVLDAPETAAAPPLP